MLVSALGRLSLRPKVLSRLSSMPLDDSGDLASLEYVDSREQCVFEPVISVFDNSCRRVCSIENYPPHLRDKFQDPSFRHSRESSMAACTGSFSKAYALKSFTLEIGGVVHHCVALVYARPFKVKQEAAKRR